MNLRRERFAVGGLIPLTLGVAMAVASWPAASADKKGLKPVWSVEAEHDMLRFAVGMDGNVVYARDGKKLTGLNTADGSQKFVVDLPGFAENGYSGHVEDTTYVYSTSREVVGIDVDSGKERWRKSPGEGIKPDVWREPRVGNPKAMLLSFENGVSVWDIAPGRLLWSAKEHLSYDIVPNSWANDADPETGVLMFFDKRTVLVGPSGKELWSAAEKGNEDRGGKDVLMPAVYSYGRLLLVYLAKQVVLLNSVTGEVLASQTFSSSEAAADVEALLLQEGGAEASNSVDANPPLALTLAGRVVIADPKQGKVIAKSPENSVIGQTAGGFAGNGDVVVMTAVRGGDKTANSGLHLYRINPATGDVKWHAQNGQLLGTGQVMSTIVGEKIHGPYRLDKAKGVLLATSNAGVHLYDWETGKERWTVNQDLPNSYLVTKLFGSNSFSVIPSTIKDRVYVSTNPRPVEGDDVVYVAGGDNVFAIDSASGKVKWESKSRSLSLVSGLEASGGTVIARQGLHADSNDFGAPTSIVTRFLGPAFEEEPVVYIEEDPYGYVGLDAATGKESWKCLEFEAHDADMRGAMPKDASICKVPKVSKEKGCKLSRLGIGDIVFAYATASSSVYFGKDGMAGAPPGSCSAQWKVDGSIKKQTRIYAVSSGGESRGLGFLQHDDPPYVVTHFENEVKVVDVAAGKILVSSDKAESVKVKWSKKLLFVAEGSDVAMYQLP